MAWHGATVAFPCLTLRAAKDAVVPRSEFSHTGATEEPNAVFVYGKPSGRARITEVDGITKLRVAFDIADGSTRPGRDSATIDTSHSNVRISGIREDTKWTRVFVEYPQARGRGVGRDAS